MKPNTIIQGDCLEKLKELSENSIDSIVTDPPYGWSFMGKAWDYDVPKVEVWKEVLRVLKPGGHALVACGTRTQHRMAVNIEDAGFEIRDLVAWVYGSGFPKSLNIGKAVDKLQGNEREITETKVKKAGDMRSGNFKKGGNYDDIEIDVTKGTSPYEGWGTAMKPAVEYWTLARKPLESSTPLLYTLINKICQSPSFVTTVKESLKSNPKESDGDVNIAQWSVGDSINTLEDLHALMDMLRLYTMENTSLSIVLSWLSILEEIWTTKNTSTTKTKLNLTTELKILRSLEWENILQGITQKKESLTNGQLASVSDVVSLFNVLRLKLNVTPTPIAPDRASLDRIDLSPNLELWTLARKPFKGSVAENVLKWGTGGINIDESRVETNRSVERQFDKEDASGKTVGTNKGSTNAFSYGKNPRNDDWLNTGRFPANFIHDGSDEVVGLFPNTKSGDIKKGNNFGFAGKIFGDSKRVESKWGGDSGSASRFFYCAKASKSERNKGLEGFEDKKKIYRATANGTGEISKNMERFASQMKNNHPTVKPISLMRYLVKLITPSQGIVLDPFMGSGTTGIACKLDGFNFIGIEIEPDYIKIAEARINSCKHQESLF